MGCLAERCGCALAPCCAINSEVSFIARVRAATAGGGWCYSDSECLARTSGVLGSSDSYPPTLELSEENAMFGAPFEQLSNNATANPPLYAYSKIFLPYGDGTSQVSDLAEPVSVGNSTVFYRGARVLRALIARLAATELAGATEVVLGGSSAGGLSTYLYVGIPELCSLRCHTCHARCNRADTLTSGRPRYPPHAWSRFLTRGSFSIMLPLTERSTSKPAWTGL